MTGAGVDDLGHRAVDARSAPSADRLGPADTRMRLRPDDERAGPAEDGLRGGAVEHVGGADEVGDEAVGRILVDVTRRADLLDAALVEDGESVAQRQRLVLVVGDEDEGDADLALDRLELDLHLLAQLEVERAERLVEQQHPRPVDERAGQRDALALAAGELRRPAVAEVLAEPHHVQRLQRAPRGARLLADLLDPQPVLDVLEHVHVREQRVVLEDGVDPRPGRTRSCTR